MDSEPRIPTLLGLGILIIGLVVGVFLVTRNQTLLTKASTQTTPKNITVTNLSSDSAVIYWVTDTPTSGYVQIGTTPLFLDRTYRDDRDAIELQSHTIHFVTLNNLIPNTTYYYKIISGATPYPQNSPLTFTTSVSTTPIPLYPIVGTILNYSKQPVKEALVTLEIPGAQTLTAVTKNSGSFIIPLSILKTNDLSQAFIFSKEIEAKLTVTDFTTTSTGKIRLPIENTNSLPEIILGKDFDFTIKVSSASAIP